MVPFPAQSPDGCPVWGFHVQVAVISDSNLSDAQILVSASGKVTVFVNLKMDGKPATTKLSFGS